MLPEPPFQLPLTNEMVENLMRQNNLCQQMLILDRDAATKVPVAMYLRPVSDVGTLLGLHTEPAKLAVPQSTEEE